MEDLVGRTLGPYKITSELGQGGMANVYRATQPSVGREVAIKVLPAHFLQDKDFVKRFEREVQVIAKLQHPHILPVYDFGQHEGIPYIVMSYMPGGTLSDLMHKTGPMPLDEVVRLVDQIASGLDHAHRKGIVHRDFKPSNVLLDENNNVYLADFGIAKMTESTSQITGSGIIGTPAYMAPEATDTGKVTPQFDVYALGVTLFEMLAGQHPFPSETPVGVLLAHVSKPVPAVNTHQAGLPPGVQAVIDRAMAKEPNERYKTAGALASDLRAVLKDEAPGTQLIARPARDDSPVTVPLSPTRPMAEEAPKSNRRFIGAAVGISTVVIALAIIFGPRLFGATTTSTQPPGGTPSAPDGVTILSGHIGRVTSVAVSPDGQLASGGADKTVIVWDSATGTPGLTLELPNPAYSMVFYPDGSTLIVGGEEGTLTFWDAVTGDQQFKQEFLPAGQISVAISRDPLLYTTASRDMSFSLFKSAKFEWQAGPQLSDAVWSVAISGDAKTVAAGLQSGKIELRDVATPDTVVKTLEGHIAPIRSLAFSPDDKTLASASSDKTVILWDAAAGSRLRKLEGHDSVVNIVAFSPDGSLLASGDDSGVVIVWDTATGELVQKFEGGGGKITGVAFGVDGTTLAIGMPDGAVWIRGVERK